MSISFQDTLMESTRPKSNATASAQEKKSDFDARDSARTQIPFGLRN